MRPLRPAAVSSGPDGYGHFPLVSPSPRPWKDFQIGLVQEVSRLL